VGVGLAVGFGRILIRSDFFNLFLSSFRSSNFY
jgi:hypothetical protein